MVDSVRLLSAQLVWQARKSQTPIRIKSLRRTPEEEGCNHESLEDFLRGFDAIGVREFCTGASIIGFSHGKDRGCFWRRCPRSHDLGYQPGNGNGADRYHRSRW